MGDQYMTASAIAEMPINAQVGKIVNVIFNDKIISQITALALNPEQRDYLNALPQPARDLAYQRVMASMRTSACWQVAFICRVGISQPALERLVEDAQVETVRRQCDTQLARQLMAAGANFPLARCLLGIDKVEFNRLRKEQEQEQDQPNPTSNKAVEIGEEESIRIYRYWEALGKPVDAAGLLSLYAESGQPIYVLWGLVQDWQHALRIRG
jgi:hypothetical protein